MCYLIVTFHKSPIKLGNSFRNEGFSNGLNYFRNLKYFSITWSLIAWWFCRGHVGILLLLHWAIATVNPLALKILLPRGNGGLKIFHAPWEREKRKIRASCTVYDGLRGVTWKPWIFHPLQLATNIVLYILPEVLWQCSGSHIALSTNSGKCRRLPIFVDA
jgi:hypothetical protein